jgi:hypothetical protein
MKKPFERIITIMFENQYRSYVMQNEYMRKLAKAGASMDNFFGIFHPSQTNYIASLAGEVCAITNDTPPAKPLAQKNLVDLFEESNISWKAYMEAYPIQKWNPIWQTGVYPPEDQPITSYPNDGTSLARYFRKHNAFASFKTIQSDKDRWSKITDDCQFWKDVELKQLPQYSWFTPDIWNDGHYVYNTHTDTNPRTQLIPQISNWLEYVFFSNIESKKVQGGVETGLSNIGLNLDIDLLLTDPQKAWKLSKVPKGTLIVITFDEADFNAVGFDTSYDGPNQVYTVLLGEKIAPGTKIDTPYNHFSLIKTIQKNYGLNSLNKNDKGANWIRQLWDEKFKWSKVSDTNIKPKTDLALTAFKDSFYLITKAKNGDINENRFLANKWSIGSLINIKNPTQLALSFVNETLVLVSVNTSKEIEYSTSSGDGVWSDPTVISNFKSHGSITLNNYFDEASQEQNLMLCWQSEKGFIQYLTFNKGKWSEEASEVGQITDGPMALCQLGPSLYLIYKEKNTKAMRLSSYNLAPYNAFDGIAFDDSPAPQNNTSMHCWSPADMPVGNFAQKLNAIQNEYLTQGKMSVASIEGEMHMIYRGAYDDTPTARTTYFGLTGILTASNQLTNGFGTLNQAGWTKESSLDEIQLNPNSAIDMASDGEKIMTVWQDKESKSLKFIIGKYSPLTEKGNKIANKTMPNNVYSA